MPPLETADYDSVSLYIDPTGLGGSADRLRSLAQEVADSITSIQHTLEGLALGWAGKTQEEAQAMNQRWTAVMRELFGSEGDAGSGVLNVVASGTAAVAMGSAHIEVEIADMFRRFSESLAAPGDGSGTPTSPPSDRTDTTITAITADW